jgi:hypothetical protein
MILEGYILYKMVFAVFESVANHSRILYAGAYGVPALIVSITGIVAAAKSDHAYGSDA